MIYSIDKKDVEIGISACLVGEKVRYDGKNKPSKFCLEQLSSYVTYKSFCPEVAIGLPVPRPTIRLIEKAHVIHVSRPDGSGDVTKALNDYGQQVIRLNESLSGYIFCTKSPSCGMENVKVFNPEGDRLPDNGVGAFAKEILAGNPLLPCEEDVRLEDAIIAENFVARVFAYKHWQVTLATGLTKHKLTSFHSQYKYRVMSHDLSAYKKLGQLLANTELSLRAMSEQYISGLMTALKIIATRKNQANTLAHIQGYFSKQLDVNEKQALREKIEAYRVGAIPIKVPLNLIKQHLVRYPNDYLIKQAYLSPYPDELLF